MRRWDAVLDTSSLQKLIDGSRGALFQRSPYRLLVPLEVLGEVLDGEAEHAQRAARKLKSALLALHPALQLANGLRETLEHELRQRVTELGVLDHSAAGELLDAIANGDEQKRELACGGIRAAKASAADWDQGLKNDLIRRRDESGITAMAMLDELAALGVSNLPEVLVRQAVAIAPERLPDIPTLLRTLPDHPALLAFCGLYFLSLWGRITADEGDQRAHALRPHRNDWIDASIAASAAYAGLFVTEERLLRPRCALARSKRFLHFEAIKFDELCARTEREQIEEPLR